MPAPVLVIGNKNYSSWSLRSWLATKVEIAGAEKETEVVPQLERCG